MKKIIGLIVALTLVLTVAVASATTIAVPNDPTNEGRALMILQEAGIIKLTEEAGVLATKDDIAEFITTEFELVEVDADVVPSVKGDVDYAIINGNYALEAKIDPRSALLTETAIGNPYINVVSVKDGNQDTDAAKALAAALKSKQVVDYINETYSGVVVSSLTEEELTDGYDETVDYEALKGVTISVAATPRPHEEILKDVVAGILGEKGIVLDVVEVTNYTTPNDLVEAGDVFANYFAHQPYQNSYNEGMGTHLVTIAGIHVEPMGLYGGQQSDLTALGIGTVID